MRKKQLWFLLAAQNMSARWLTTLFVALVPVVVSSCVSSPHQTVADRMAVLSAIQIGQRVKVAFNDPRGWSSLGSECNVEFKNDEGMTCGGNFIFYERVTSINLKSSSGLKYAKIPLMPVAVAAWVAASMVCPDGCAKSKKTAVTCNVSWAETDNTERVTRVVLISESVAIGTKFVNDGLRDTVEIVTWKPDVKGRSHIEGDGEVVYLVPGSPEEAKRQLLREAMFYKTVAAKNVKEHCVGPWYANSRKE